MMVVVNVKHLKERKKELDNCYQEILDLAEDNFVTPEGIRRAWKSSKRFESGLLCYFVSQIQQDRVTTYIKSILQVLARLCENRHFLPHRIFEAVDHQDTLMPLQAVDDIIANLKDRRDMMTSALSMIKFFDYIEHWTKNNMHTLSTDRTHQLQSNLTEGRQKILDLIIRYRLYEYTIKLGSEVESLLKNLSSFLKSSYMKGMIKEFMSEESPDFLALRNTLIYLLVIESGGMCTEYVSKISMSDFKSQFIVEGALILRSSTNNLIILNKMVKKLLFKYVQELRLNPMKPFKSDQEYLFVPYRMHNSDLVHVALSKLKEDMKKAGFQVKVGLDSADIQRYFSTLRGHLLDTSQTSFALEEMIRLSYRMNAVIFRFDNKKLNFKRKISLDHELSEKTTKKRRVIVTKLLPPCTMSKEEIIQMLKDIFVVNGRVKTLSTYILCKETSKNKKLMKLMEEWSHHKIRYPTKVNLIRHLLSDD